MNIPIAEHTKYISVQFLDTFWHISVTLIKCCAQTYSHFSGAGGDPPASSQREELLPCIRTLRYFSR
jgi:hypothetical protein